MLKYWIIVCFTKILFIYIFWTQTSGFMWTGFRSTGNFWLERVSQSFPGIFRGIHFLSHNHILWMDDSRLHTDAVQKTWPQGCIYMIKWWWCVGGMILATTASVLRESLFAIYVLFIISRHIHHYWYTNVWQRKGKANSEYLNICNVC